MKNPARGERATAATAATAAKADLLPLMDYLHGDVIDGEHEAACYYEYARKSDTLLAAAKEWEKDPSAPIEFVCGYWFYQDPWAAIWQCPSFPAKTWNQLSPPERAEIIRLGSFRLPFKNVRPLRMFDVRHLDQTGILDKLKAMAETQKQDITKGRQKASQRVYPVIEGWPNQPQGNSPFVHALLSLDFTKTPTQLRKEFAAWLDLPEIKRRRDSHKQKPMGKTGIFLDRLKDIASWRISDALGWKVAQEFARKHRKRDGKDRP